MTTQTRQRQASAPAAASACGVMDYDPDDNARKSYDVGIEALRSEHESSSHLDGRVKLYRGDCMEVLKHLPDCSVDSVVCDPPYHLTTGKKGGAGIASLNLDSPAGRSRISTGGFMGKIWDGGDIAFRPETWAQVLRVLKPGGHLVAFGGTRTYHRLACAIEDAGFECRDAIMWHYGSGFPKSHSVDRAIDKAAGAEREVVGFDAAKAAQQTAKAGTQSYGDFAGSVGDITAPATDAAKQWQGWGTALKPATEIICLARKPLSESTVAANVLKWGTGAINIDGCRVASAVGDEPLRWEHGRAMGHHGAEGRGPRAAIVQPLGRWPANLILDGSEEVLAAFPDAPGQGGSVSGGEPSSLISNVYAGRARVPCENPRIDSGSAARFFASFPMEEDAKRFHYTSKAGAGDRLGSRHPTVKPLDLMQWLVRLVTPKGGMVLDPFAGTGTTGEAAWREGCRAILIEREPEYQADIARRMELATKPTKRAAVAKSKNKLDRPEDLPLFATEVTS